MLSLQKELKWKREAAEKKRRHEAEEERLRKLEEEQLMLEEKERDRIRCEVEKMEKMEMEKNRQAEEEQRRLAEAMQCAKDEQERKLQEETERLAHDEEERRNKRYRKVVEKETEALLKSQNRWYYEGGNGDWQGRRRSASKVIEREQLACGELPQFSKVVLPPVNTTVQQDLDTGAQVHDAEPDHSPSKTSKNANSQQTFPGAKPRRRSKRRAKSPAKKSTSESEVNAAVDDSRPDCVLPEVVDDLETGVTTMTTTTTQAADD